MHTSEMINRVMQIRAQVIERLGLVSNGKMLPNRECEAIVAQYVQAVVTLDATDNVAQAVDRGNPC